MYFNDLYYFPLSGVLFFVLCCVAIAASSASSSASSSPSVSSFVRSIVSSLSEIVEEVVCFYNSRISRSIHIVFFLLFIVAFGGVALDTSSLPPFFGVSFYLVLLLAIGVRIRTQGQINSHYITFAELSTNTTVIISYAMLCYAMAVLFI